MTFSNATHSFPDLVALAHLRRHNGGYALARRTYLAAASRARIADLRDYETILLRHAWDCHVRALKAHQ